MRGLDVRAVANLVLDEAALCGFVVTNLHLNKIIYFMHVRNLADNGKPLVSAKIEAWEFGPVFREVYNQFKRFGGRPITSKAWMVDYASGRKIDAWCRIEEDYGKYLRRIARIYTRIPANVLVDISHDAGGAWDKAWNHEGVFNVGMEITEDMIREFDLIRINSLRELQ